MTKLEIIKGGSVTKFTVKEIRDMLKDNNILDSDFIEIRAAINSAGKIHDNICIWRYSEPIQYIKPVIDDKSNVY